MIGIVTSPFQGKFRRITHTTASALKPSLQKLNLLSSAQFTFTAADFFVNR
jgi:hypothetical protein